LAPMFGMGMGELLVVLVVVLLVFGPGRLPEMMGNLGKAMREFQKGLHEPPELGAPATNRTPSADAKREDAQREAEPQPPPETPSPNAGRRRRPPAAAGGLTPGPSGGRGPRLLQAFPGRDRPPRLPGRDPQRVSRHRGARSSTPSRPRPGQNETNA